MRLWHSRFDPVSGPRFGSSRRPSSMTGKWLAALALAGIVATPPVSAFETGVHERVTRNALPFLSEGVLYHIVEGNEDEDQGDAYHAPERHGQNCLFQGMAGYANQRYGEVIAALTQPSTSDPFRAARLFGHITHGIQDFYSHSNWIPTPPQGLGIRNRILDPGLGKWTLLSPYSNMFDDVVNIEGNPPNGWSAVLPRNARGFATSGVPIVVDRSLVGASPRTYRGLMMSVSGKTEASNQLCPPIGSDCSILLQSGRPAEALCLRHGSKRSNGSSAKTFSPGILSFPKLAEGRMNLDGGGGLSGDWFEARHYAKLQTQHEWCRLLHLSREDDPTFGAAALLLGTWVAKDSAGATPHIASTPCARGAVKRTLVEVTASSPGPASFVLFRGDFTSSARTRFGALGTRTLSICGNTNETVVAALNRWNSKGPIAAFQVPAVARSWTVRDHRGAFGGSFSIKVTPNLC